MTTVRDVMSPDVECARPDDTLVEVARRMAALDVGAIPVRDEDGRPVGVVTDRDIVVSCLARGGDPALVSAGDLVRGAPVTVEAGDDLDDALELMQENQLRRLLVMDDDELVGIVSQRDVALAAEPEAVGETVEAISV